MLLDDARMLGVTKESYSEAGVKKCFRQTVLTVHPDVGGTTEDFMAADRAQNNLLLAISQGITASQLFGGEKYSFDDSISFKQSKNNLNGITSLDLLLLVSHISMLYYGDTLELTARSGRTFRYSPRDFKSGEVVPYLKDYVAWNCGSRNGLVEILQPFEFSYSPRIAVSVTVESLEPGLHRFTMMFGGRAFDFDFIKRESSLAHIATEMEFPVSYRYVNGVRTGIMLTIELELRF